MKFNLADSAYEVHSSPLILQECINLYPEALEHPGGRGTMSLRRIPGLSSWSTVGTGPIRGMAEMDGVLYCVSGTSLYSINSSGTETSLGTITGTGRVGMAVNLASPKELMIVGGNTGYTYDTTNGLVTISDVDFPSVENMVVSLDGYFVVIEKDTAKFWISNVLDGQNWTGTDFATKEAAPGDLVAIIPNHRDLFLFGERTFEVWRNTGNADFPFQRQEGTFQQRGCAARYSVADIDNTVFFLGDDRIVYRIDGYQPVRISNHGVEHALSDYTESQISAASAYTYTDRGHIFYCLNVGTDTWVYDSTTSGVAGRSMWHKRQTGSSGRWRVDNHINIYGKHLGGDYSSGIVWHMDNSTYTDNGNEVYLQRTIGPIFKDNRPISIPEVQLHLTTGHDVTPEAQVMLEVSRDGGKTWGPVKYRNLGLVGQYGKPVTFKRLGRGNNFYFRITITDGVDISLNELYADVEIGSG